MNFGSGGNMKAKAWKDIWGSGQGLGIIKDAPDVATVVKRLREDYERAVADFGSKQLVAKTAAA